MKDHNIRTINDPIKIRDINKVRDILIEKVATAIRMRTNLDKLINSNVLLLTEDERENLPKLKKRFGEGDLSRYIGELKVACQNPIRIRKIEELKKMGLKNTELIKEGSLDYLDPIEIRPLIDHLKKYNRLFVILSEEMPTIINQKDEKELKNYLEKIGREVNLDKLLLFEDKIRSQGIKSYYLKQYLFFGTNILDVEDLFEKIRKVEKFFPGVVIEENEKSFVESLYEPIHEAEKFNITFNQACKNLGDAKDKLQQFILEMNEELSSIKSEIHFWSKLNKSPESTSEKNIPSLRKVLETQKEISKKHYSKSFEYFVSIFQHNISDKIENLPVFAKKLEDIANYVSEITIFSKTDILDVEKIYQCSKDLEKIGIMEPLTVSNPILFHNITPFITDVKNVEYEYHFLQKLFKDYSILLQSNDIIPDKYGDLKIKNEEFRVRLIESLGDDFENLISFLKGDIANLDVDDKTIRNFIKRTQPIIKDALKL